MPDSTTIGGLLSAIGIAGMDRLVQHNVLAMSAGGEAAGDVNTLLLDKTGTITLAIARPRSSFARREFQRLYWPSAQLSSLPDETPRAGRSWC
jgi:K+-transporting ATPase ATPase B chain